MGFGYSIVLHLLCLYFYVFSNKKISENQLKNLEEINYSIVEQLFKKYAVATVVTKQENDTLNSKDVGLRSSTISDENIWLRYNNKKFKIKIYRA